MGACIDSVLRQSLEDLELVVVDDGSTDGSLEVIRSYRDPRIRIIEQDNRGVSVARNRGAELSSAPFLAFLDADDLFEPDNLERKVPVLEGDDEAVLVHSHRLDFDENGELGIVDASRCADEALEPLLTFTATVNGPSSAVVRTSAFEGVGGFDPALSTSADRDLWIRLALTGSFRYLFEPLVRYRRHGAQMHRDVAAMEEDLTRIGEKLREDPRIPRRLLRAFARKRARVLAGSWWHDAGRRGRAFRWGLEYALRRLLP